VAGEILWLCAAALAYLAGRLFAERRLAALHAELFRENAHMRLLECAAAAANEAGTLGEAMEAGLRRICLAMGWPVGRIHVVEAEGSLQQTAAFVAGDEPSRRGPHPLPDARLATGESLAERARHSGRPEGPVDLAAGSGALRSRLAAELDLHAAVALPVVANGRVVAVLEFATRELAAPDPRLLEILALVGVQLGRVAERAAVEERLREARKLEAIGRLSAGIAHEINDPMAFVRSNLNHLATEWKRLRSQIAGSDAGAAIAASLAECDALIEETLEGVERTVSIVRDVRELATVGEDARAPADLREMVDTALRVASSQVPPGVTLDRRDVGDAPPPLTCCRNQLIRVFVELVVNAIEAASPAGRVEVTTLVEDEVAIVQVEDTGPGLSEETRERIFDPLFTSRAGASGAPTGITLAIANEILRKHGGHIRLFSAEGAGTVVEVRLPLPPAAQPQASPRRGPT
jgi:signal transduction histidine kinase